MNEATNEQLDRFLFGEMNTAEQQLFLADATSNPELGRIIATEQQIESKLRADRDAVPNNHALTRQKMLALAAATPVAEHAAGNGSTGGQAGGWFGKMVAGSVAAIGVVGGIIWLSSGNKSIEQQTVVPAVQPVSSPSPTAPPQLQQQAPVAPVIEAPAPLVNSERMVNRRATAEPSIRNKTSNPTAEKQGIQPQNPKKQVFQENSIQTPAIDVPAPFKK